jgi:hypothetical protein
MMMMMMMMENHMLVTPFLFEIKIVSSNLY